MKVLNISSTILSVTWDSPLQHETHGLIRHYKIRYREVNCISASENLTAWKVLIVNGQVRNVVLKNLAKWSCYVVQIVAVTVKDGKWSAEIQHRTSEDGMNYILQLIC